MVTLGKSLAVWILRSERRHLDEVHKPDDLTPEQWLAYRQELAAKERKARMKAKALPLCEVCGNPLWLGQNTRHYTCDGTVAIPAPRVHTPGSRPTILG